MIYKFNRNGIEEEVKLEKWVWHVVYKDGTDLLQFDPSGVFHQFSEIKQDQVVIFEMLKSADPKVRHSIDVVEGMQLHHFYRRAVLFFGTPKETSLTFTCFGFKVEQTPIYYFILPDDRIVITTNRNITLIK